jgi:hypothetical protein
MRMAAIDQIGHVLTLVVGGIPLPVYYWLEGPVFALGYLVTGSGSPWETMFDTRPVESTATRRVNFRCGVWTR